MGWFSNVVDAVRSRLGAGTGPEPPPPGQFDSIEAVIARMREIDAQLPESDGLRAFHHMYLHVTEVVRDRIAAGAFTDPAFMTRLDIVFAGLYLDAVSSAAPDKAWAPVFEARHELGRLPIQFAIAGMNAHINHDLPIAVVTACRQLGVDIEAPAVAADYQQVTDVLATVQEEVRESFLAGLALEVDQHLTGPVANLVGAWSIGRAREAAWTNANVLRRLNGLEPLRSDFLLTLSSSVGLAGRCLLVPVTDLA